jgi:hypothetical protein
MKRLTRVLTLAAIFLLVAGPVRAGRFFIQVHGGFALFDLDDVNDSIDRVNESVGDPVLGQIYSGPDAGLHVGFALSPELDLGFGYSRQWASSGYARDGFLVEYDLPADLYEISLDFLPATEKSVRFGAGTTLGMISSAASLLVAEPNVPDSHQSFDGVGFHFAAYAIMDVPLSPAWSLFGQLGLRHALLNHLKVDGETVYNPDSLTDKLRFNYSGLLLRVGVRFRP